MLFLSYVPLSLTAAIETVGDLIRFLPRLVVVSMKRSSQDIYSVNSVLSCVLMMMCLVIVIITCIPSFVCLLYVYNLVTIAVCIDHNLNDEDQSR